MPYFRRETFVVNFYISNIFFFFLNCKIVVPENSYRNSAVIIYQYSI